MPDILTAKMTREARPPRRPRPSPPPPALVARAALELPVDSVVLAHLRSDATIEPLIRRQEALAYHDELVAAGLGVNRADGIVARRFSIGTRTCRRWRRGA